MPEHPTSVEKGNQIVSLLQTPTNLHGLIYRNGGNVSVTDEEGAQSRWDFFVSFPRELSAAFPGSYVSPTTFLTELGIGKEHIPLINRRILGHEIGTQEEPVLQYKEDAFELTVMNGMLNEHALEMTKLADASMRADGGFRDHPEIRAPYQKHMYENIKEALRPSKSAEALPAYRIHDDCLASGDSVASYLWEKIQRKDELTIMQEKGVEVVIDGPATAQSLLFLKAFAKAHQFKIHIIAGHMAFGLSQGLQGENGVRKHANYITYPDELLEQLAPVDRELLRSHRSQDGNIYVVGDMGEAEKGINQEMMQGIRRAESDQDLCKWNDTREDPHGDHQKRKDAMPIPTDVEGLSTSVYFARGGYLPYELDRMAGVVNGYNVRVYRVSRKWTKEYGYGAAIKEHDES